MIKVELTGEQLDNLIDILEYTANCEYEHFKEYLEEGGNPEYHLYTKVTELMNLNWSKV